MNDQNRMNTTGRCLCGAVTFNAEGVSPDVHACHCSICRHWLGGPSFSVDARAVTFKGEQHIGRYDSSAWAERGFCQQCGTSLFFRLKEQDHYILSAGSLDDSATFKLTTEIYVDEKPAGYAFAGEHPRLTAAEFMATLEQAS